jgi:hypothetical protein
MTAASSVYKIPVEEQEKGPDFWASYIETAFEYSRNSREERVEREWFLNYCYKKGLKVKYDTRSDRMVIDNRLDDKFQANKIKAIERAVTNYVTQLRMRWDVDARPYGSLNLEVAKKLGDYLDYQFDRLDVNSIQKAIISYGLMYTRVPIFYGWDELAEEGLGDVMIRVDNPFDVYIDPNATSVSDAQYVIRVVRKPLESIKADPRYTNTDQIAADNKYAASIWKDKLDNISNGYSKSEKNAQTSLMYELWARDSTEEVELDELGNPILDPKTGEQKTIVKQVIRCVSSVNKTIIRNDVTDYEDLPFIDYAVDVEPDELYGYGYIHDLIPMQRAINKIQDDLLRYHHKFAKGKYVTTTNADIKVIEDQHGEIIQTKPGTSLTPLPLQSAPSSLQNQDQIMNNYLQDISGVGDAFLGRLPSADMSGVALETLISSSGNNLRNYVEEMESVLSKLGEMILKMASKYYDTTRAVRKAERSSQAEYFQVIGMESVEKNGGEAPDNVIQIPYNSEVTVKLTSGLSHTKEAKQEKLKELRLNGDISRQTLLEELGFDADIEEQRLINEQIRPQVEMQQVMEEMGMASQPSPEEQSAMEEEQMMAEQEQAMQKQEEMMGIQESLATQIAEQVEKTIDEKFDDLSSKILTQI